MISNPVNRFIIICFAMFSLLTNGCSDQSKDAPTPSSGYEKKTIAVIGHGDFLPDRIDTTQGTIGLPDNLAARIMEYLSTSQRFTVVERTALRKVVMEQRFGQVRESYMDRTLEKAIGGMDDINPFNLAVTGALVEKSDLLKDFQDLGSTVGADYIVLGTIEKLEARQASQILPYSKTKLGVTKNILDARLRLRVIDTESGGLLGAISFRAKFTENVFSGQRSDSDSYTLYDKVGRMAATRILDLTFPAHIAGTQPLIMTRGSNDGVKVGDTYTILREGDEVRDKNGVSIGRVRSTVSMVRVASTQSTLSTVEQVGEGNVARGDIALLAEEMDVASGKPVRSGVQIGRGQNGKATIAVGKLRLNRAFNNASIVPSYIEKMTNDLVIQLGNTLRFDVLERSEIDQVLDEKSFEAIVHGGDTFDRLNELDGADYIIHGEIDDFNIKTTTEKAPYIDEIITRHVGIASGTVRIVDVHNGKIIAADKIRLNEDQKDVKDSNNQPLEHLMEVFTTAMTARVIERLYPIKVLGSAGEGLVYINRGVDGGLKTGDVFNLMQPGKELIDPDTGLSFGTADINVGEVEIASVENSRAIAKFVSGNVAHVGSILRRKHEATMEKEVEPVNQPNW